MDKTKIGIYLSKDEHSKLKEQVLVSGKTLTNYCKEKIFNIKSPESKLEVYLLREIENLLYILLSQNPINETYITEDKINTVHSLSTFIGNLKSINNKQLSIKKDNRKLFSIVNKPTIEKLISQVNATSKSHDKIILMAEFITSIKKVL